MKMIIASVFLRGARPPFRMRVLRAALTFELLARKGELWLIC
ncbi:hypothetical protein FBY34_5688 [Streptomyces sp. SLBN-115]|nr:hypothetical protein FBY34_5688 [Streptomyces sp. SLBN-115]